MLIGSCRGCMGNGIPLLRMQRRAQRLLAEVANASWETPSPGCCMVAPVCAVNCGNVTLPVEARGCDMQLQTLEPKWLRTRYVTA
mmetsp:Transcript_11533/g.9120  ORF Transcript_11533/g.9120 Transcript_11533/m.9120 type:complete len:85 (+) Transcript_11533:221-475(+)